jgi:hypothetical protein
MCTSHRSQVLVQRTANCPAAAGQEAASAFFRRIERDAEASEVRLPLRAFGLPMEGSITHPVRFQFGLHENVTEAGMQDDEIAFTWTVANRLLPDFHGTLHAHSAPQARTKLVIEGSYMPPLGFLGGLFDRLLGHTFAQHTVQHLVDTIAEQLEVDQRAFQAKKRRLR